MRNSIRRTPLLIALAAVLTLLVVRPALAQDWAGRARVHGVVTDDEKKPLEGATIHLYFKGNDKLGPKPLTTDKKGNWGILGLADGQWSVVIEKEGYVSSQGTVNVSEFQVTPPVVISLRNLEHTEAAQKGRELRGDVDNANAAFTAGDYTKARELYLKVLPSVANESKPRVQMAIAQTFVNEKHYEEALPYLDQVLAAEPTNIDAKRLEASIYGETGKTDKAMAMLDQIIQQTPGDTQAIQLAANIMISQGKQEEAKKYLAMMPAGSKVDPDALLNMGIQKYNANSYKEALTYFDQVVSQEPNLPEGYYYRGLAYLASGDGKAAKADFKKFLEIAPNHAKAAEVKEFLKSL
jgi:tetratricopeptide (TPR) repeat protein